MAAWRSRGFVIDGINERKWVSARMSWMTRGIRKSIIRVGLRRDPNGIKVEIAN